MSLVKKIVCITLSVLLTVFLLTSLYMDNKQQKMQAESIAEAIAEAKPYERELEEIKSELSEMEAAISYVSETARFIIGFELSDVSDLLYIQEQAEAYQFSPVLVLDCTDELETLELYMDAAAETDWEIMLFADSFSEGVNEDVLAARQALANRGMEDAGVFLLRTDYATAENIQLLIDDGFIGYTVYNDVPTSGYTEEGIIYFDYSYMRTSNETINSRLSLMYSNKCTMLTLFDLESVWDGTMPESYVASVLDLAKTYAGYDDACFSAIADVVSELNGDWEDKEERQAAYDDYAARQQERMDELNTIIDGIYDGLSDGS